MIKVKLRIVGLYFNTTVSIEDKEGLSVRDVLNEYIRLNPNLAVVGGLEYTRFPAIDEGVQYPRSTHGSSDFVRAFSYNYGGKFDFDGNGSTDDAVDGKTLGNQEREKGIYTLSEDLEDSFLTKKVGLVWQHYVVSKTGSVKSKTPASRGFNAFGEAPKGFKIEDEDTIIWRLVAIARNPNFLIP